MLSPSLFNYVLFFFKGKEFKTRIKTFINEFDDFHLKILPFISKEDGKKILKDCLSLINQTHPWIIDEMRGGHKRLFCY